MKKSILDFCKNHKITEDQFFGRETVGGYLDLRSVTSLPDGFNPTVGGYLYLGSVTSLPDGFNPTVGGDLYLGSVTSLPDGFNPTVGGYLDLRSVTSLPDGFNPTVGGDLYLGSVTSLPDGFNPTVGGYLYLGSVTSLPDGFNINKFQRQTVRPVQKVQMMSWHKNGKEYIKCDGRFSEVVSRKGNVWKLKDVNKHKTYFLVGDGNGKYAHGSTTKEAREDLIFKISNRDKSEYKGIDLDKKLPFEKCVEMYRVITGACSTGVRNFLESKSIKRKSFSANEIIGITKGAYGGSTFSQFFGINPK